MTRIHDPTANRWRFLVTTNRGLEPVAKDELRELGASELSTLYPGMVEFTSTESMVCRLHGRGRTVHRLLFEFGRGDCSSLAEITALIDDLDMPRYLGPEQSFAVRAQRRGNQPFSSPDIEETVGQAIVDTYRRNKQTRPPVDLEDPDLIVRVFVRQELVIVTLDTTGQYSLHRRDYRVVEHEAPIRPTMAAAMYRLAECRPGDRIIDPMCGCGTLPIEAAKTALGWPPETESAPAFEQFQFLEPRSERKRLGPEELSLDIAGRDIDEQSIAGAHKNAQYAGLGNVLDFDTADVQTDPVEADIVLTDMPFGIRTGGDVRPLYRAFADWLAESDCRRAVVHTARGDLLKQEPTERIEMRRGRLETVMLVIE